MSRSYIHKCEPSVNPTTFWFCQKPEDAFIFEGTARADFFCHHLNQGVNVKGMLVEVFRIEPRGENRFAIYSETPFEELEKLNNPAYFPWPESATQTS